MQKLVSLALFTPLFKILCLEYWLLIYYLRFDAKHKGQVTSVKIRTIVFVGRFDK